MAQRIYSFEPVWRADARLLILGSMPSVESLRQGFYYAHPRNIFWSMMAEILAETPPQSIEEKKEMLRAHKIALWDSAHSCERDGSLDSAIRAAAPNDFAMLYRNCPDIRCVIFNGSAAEALYRRMVDVDAPGLRFQRMPSTSPAYTLKSDLKKAAWRRAIMEVLENEPL